MVEARLSPAATLRTATINPAIYLNDKKDFGFIEAGKWADLVLLNGNPLEDINNTNNISAVILNGQYLSKRKLNKILKKVKAALRSHTN